VVSAAVIEEADCMAVTRTGCRVIAARTGVEAPTAVCSSLSGVRLAVMPDTDAVVVARLRLASAAAV
jgi:hypothetical protein